MDETFKKMFQKRVYDLLSHKYGILMLIFGGFLIIISALHFGEAWLEWSHEKYEAVFNSFSDNIAGKSFRERLSVPLPIDVVYTWVNGTDPGLIRQLELVKISLEEKSNLTREERCTFTNCVSVGVLVNPPLLGSVAADDVIKADAVFMNITGVTDIKEHPDWPSNFTLLTLEHETDGQIPPPPFLFQTSDMKLPHGIVVPEVIMLSGFPNEYSDGDVQQAVTGRLNISDKASVKLHKDKGMALLYISQKTHYDQLSGDKNFTIEHKVQRLSPVKLVWDLRFAVKDDVVASNRFEDNEELRYSLRSLEQFAPWVRHVYIVTNGQIPYWLNLDCPRVTVITHDEIFENISHLPTFSSPAIEANIHKIPGLSDKFLYLNDDVMFGSPVWPDDFYTHSTGQKLYLTWPVPNCNEGCPSTWIRDGYCDKACNSSECDWDGGDCLSSNGRVQLGAGFHDQGPRLTDYTIVYKVIVKTYLSPAYCNTGCANNWLADKYCDQACNNLQCGFDIGDCGVSNYNKLYGLDLHSDKLHYRLPPGELIGYFNLSGILTNKARVTSASYGPEKVIRAVAVANKFKVLTVVLNKDHNATTLVFDLEYKLGTNETSKINFTLQVDTSVARPEPTSNISKSENVTSALPVQVEDVLDAEAFKEYTGVPGDPVISHDVPPVELEDPPLLTIDVDILDLYRYLNMSKQLKEKLTIIDHANREGELTETGLKVRFYDTLQQHGAELESLQPMFREQRLKLEIQKAEDAEKRKFQNLTESPKQSLGAKKGHYSNRDPLLELNVNQGRKPQRLSRRERLQQLQDRGVGFGQQDFDGQGQYGLKRSFSSDSQNADRVNEGEKDQTESPLQAEQHKSLHVEEGSPQHGSPPAGSALKTGHIAQESPPPAGSVQDSMRANSRTIVNAPSKMGGYNAKEIYDKAKAAKQMEEQPDTDTGLRVDQLRIPASNKLGTLHNNNSIAGKTQGYVGGNDNDDNVQRGGGRKLLAILYWSQMEEQREKNKFLMKDDSLGEQMTDEEFLRLVNVDVAGENVGGFPWERKDIQEDEETSREKEKKSNEYTVEGWQGRQLLDTFGDSLRHVNHIYNKEFGFQPRKVPGHMPHMIDRNIMYELQNRFPKEWDATSSHKIRSSTDMQYAFAYYYYMMGVTVSVSVEDVFHQMDTDHSGVLSDREIRTFAARMYDLPLYLETLTGLEAMFSNCSQNLSDPTHLTEENIEHYYEKSMPQVTKHLFVNCDAIGQLVKSKVKPKLKYKTSPVDDSDITFKMIHTNVSHVVGQLDDIRKHPKKFICLNDNIDHTREEAKTVKAILQDFYESLLPIPSQFELPRDYRNRFLHMNELREWRSYRDRLRFWTHVALVVLVLLAIMSFLGEKIENLRRRWSNRKLRRRRTSSSNESTPPDSVSVTPSPTDSSSVMVWDSVLETV
ncbi:unnamed protein product [Lymnaea stagnalis]|uniref:N-acetylglucosamine-1-phosphotransferase subunits alpha/beta n=1 Tax=Lymnaea stagnalis TaxID=6523 RepID=A0AAV2IN63_LYMST